VLPHSTGVHRAIALGLLVAASAVVAREPPSVVVSPPLVIRFEGSFARDRNEAAAKGADAVSMRIGGRDRWFSAMRTRTVGADQTRNGRDVLAALAPLQPNLIVTGDEDLRRRLEEAEVGTPIEVEGLVSGSRTFLLRDVVVRPPPP
jgi:hypothetical protein